MQPWALRDMVGDVQRHFGSTAPLSGEVGLEANPSPSLLSRDRLRQFKEEAGVTRLSLGVQSLSDEQLSLLGRDHTRSVPPQWGSNLPTALSGA